MEFVPCPDVAQVELVYTIHGSVVENVLHYAGDNVSDPTVLTGLAENAITQWKASWRSLQGASVTLATVRATSLETQSAAGIEVAVTTDNVGTADGETLPANVSAVISLKTPYRGRSYRGRIFFVGLTVNQTLGSKVDDDVRSALDASFDYWDLLDVSGEPYALVVLSRFTNKAPRTTGIHTDVQRFATSIVCGSQRRRLPGRGM